MNRYQQATALGTKRYNRDRMLAMSSEMICPFSTQGGRQVQDAGEHVAILPMLSIAAADQHCNTDGLISKRRVGQSGRLDTTGLVLFGPGAREFCVPMRMVIPSIEWLSDAARQPVDRSLAGRSSSSTAAQLAPES